MEFTYIVVYFLIRIRAHFIFVAEKKCQLLLAAILPGQQYGARHIDG